MPVYAFRHSCATGISLLCARLQQLVEQQSFSRRDPEMFLEEVWRFAAEKEDAIIPFQIFIYKQLVSKAKASKVAPFGTQQCYSSVIDMNLSARLLLEMIRGMQTVAYVSKYCCCCCHVFSNSKPVSSAFCVTSTHQHVLPAWTIHKPQQALPIQPRSPPPSFCYLLRS